MLWAVSHAGVLVKAIEVDPSKAEAFTARVVQNTKVQKVFFFSSLFFFAEARSLPLNQVLKLPVLLDELYGKKEVSIKGKSSEDVKSLRAFYATQIMDKLFSAPRFSLALTRRTLLAVPSDPYAKIDYQTRIKTFGVAQMSGLKSNDKWARYWWELRLNAEDQAPKNVARKGSRIFVIAQTFPKVKSLANGMSFGHATMGTVILAGENPENDIFLNPGSNPPPGFTPTLKSSMLGQDGINNHLVASNFWDFVETQREERKVSFMLHLLGIAQMQQIVLSELMAIADGTNYGSFNILLNNCSHGARDFFNSFLRLDKEIDMAKLDMGDIKNPLDLISEPFPMVTPHKVIRGVVEAFGEIGSFAVESTAVPQGYKVPPGFSVQNYPNKKALFSYQAYSAWLHGHGY